MLPALSAAVAILTQPCIDPEFPALLPPLSAEERVLLECDNKAAGRPTDPIEGWRSLSLDGHSRFAICRCPGLPFDSGEAHGIPNRKHARLWIEENQLARRNLADGQRAAIGCPHQRQRPPLRCDIPAARLRAAASLAPPVALRSWPMICCTRRRISCRSCQPR